jgi:hypothetical protein
MYLIVGFFPYQILGIVGSYIMIEKIVFLVGILINLRRDCLQLDHSQKLIFVIKIWPNNYRVGCNSPSIMVKLIQTNINLEKRSKRLESSLENDENMMEIVLFAF